VSNMKKVLIVDDNQTNLRILEEVLAGDYRLRFANNGVEALRMASDFQPSIILLDVMMPKMDGLTVCRRLRQLPGLRDAVIIMMSAKAMPSEQAAGIDAGANAYLTKPFDEVECHPAAKSRFSTPSTCATSKALPLISCTLRELSPPSLEAANANANP
jgi:CheY-like chemotaxis protein